MRRLALLLLCSGCFTVRLVERYEVKPGAPPEAVVLAANSAAKRSGFDVTEPADGGTSFELRHARGLIDVVTVSSPDAGILAFDSFGGYGVGTIGGVLTAGTQQVLDDRPLARSHQPRSHLP